jgi:glutamine cyclotransferase
VRFNIIPTLAHDGQIVYFLSSQPNRLILLTSRKRSAISNIDFSTLWPKSERRFQRADVLNGISVSDTDGELYVTGKKWNRMYRIELN